MRGILGMLEFLLAGRGGFSGSLGFSVELQDFFIDDKRVKWCLEEVLEETGAVERMIEGFWVAFLGDCLTNERVFALDVLKFLLFLGL